MKFQLGRSAPLKGQLPLLVLAPGGQQPEEEGLNVLVHRGLRYVHLVLKLGEPGQHSRAQFHLPSDAICLVASSTMALVGCITGRVYRLPVDGAGHSRGPPEVHSINDQQHLCFELPGLQGLHLHQCHHVIARSSLQPWLAAFSLQEPYSRTVLGVDGPVTCACPLSAQDLAHVVGSMGEPNPEISTVVVVGKADGWLGWVELRESTPFKALENLGQPVQDVLLSPTKGMLLCVGQYGRLLVWSRGGVKREVSLGRPVDLISWADPSHHTLLYLSKSRAYLTEGLTSTGSVLSSSLFLATGEVATAAIDVTRGLIVVLTKKGRIMRQALKDHRQGGGPRGGICTNQPLRHMGEIQREVNSCSYQLEAVKTQLARLMGAFTVVEEIGKKHLYGLTALVRWPDGSVRVTLTNRGPHVLRLEGWHFHGFIKQQGHKGRQDQPRPGDSQSAPLSDLKAGEAAILDLPLPPLLLPSPLHVVCSLRRPSSYRSKTGAAPIPGVVVPLREAWIDVLDRGRPTPYFPVTPVAMQLLKRELQRAASTTSLGVRALLSRAIARRKKGLDEDHHVGAVFRTTLRLPPSTDSLPMTLATLLGLDEDKLASLKVAVSMEGAVMVALRVQGLDNTNNEEVLVLRLLPGPDSCELRLQATDRSLLSALRGACLHRLSAYRGRGNAKRKGDQVQQPEGEELRSNQLLDLYFRSTGICTLGHATLQWDTQVQ